MRVNTKKVDVIRIEIPKTLKTEFFAKIEKKYGDTQPITVSNVILNIFEEWITQADIENTLEQPAQSDLDAHNTDDEEDDVFCDSMGVFPGSPDPQGVFNPEDGVFPVEWNGNKNQNITRARAQVTFLLDAKGYPVLGRRLMNNILSVVENKNTEVKTL